MYESMHYLIHDDDWPFNVCTFVTSCILKAKARLAFTAALQSPKTVSPQIAGFLPRDHQWAEEVEDGSSDLPLLLLHGESDALIPMTRSRELERALQRGHSRLRRINHPGAHMVPSCSHELKVQVQEFLDAL